jgi:hypothetical protein
MIIVALKIAIGLVLISVFTIGYIVCEELEPQSD